MADGAPAAVGPTRRSPWRRAAQLAGSAFVAGLGLIVAANVYLLSTTAAQIVPSVAAAPARPVAIVLGAHVNAGRASRELLQRLAVARDLHRVGKVERILVSGAVRAAYSEPDVMVRWLLAEGVPRDAIVIDRLGDRTMATIARAQAVFAVRAAILCTQAYHLPRALFLARAAGIDAVGLAADGSRYARQTLREVLARTAVLFETSVLGMRAAGIP